MDRAQCSTLLVDVVVDVMSLSICLTRVTHVACEAEDRSERKCKVNAAGLESDRFTPNLMDLF